jgi:exonuclease SbcC
VETLRKQLADAETRLSGVQDRLADRRSERENHTNLIERGDQTRAAYEAWQAAREKLQEMETLADQHRQLDAQRQEPLAEITAAQARLEQELAGLETRKQEIDSKQAQLPEIQDRLETAQASLDESEADVERRSELEAELEVHRQQRPQMEAENQRLKVEMDELREKIDQLDREEGAECPLCGQPLSQEERTRLVASLAEQGRQKGDLFRTNKAQLDQAVQVERDLVRQIQALSSAPAKVLAHARSVEQLNAQITQIEADRANWAEDSMDRLAEIQGQLKAETFCPEARTTLEEIGRQLEKLGYDPEAHAVLRREEADGRQAEIDLRTLEKVQGERTALDREIADLEAQLGEYQTDVDARRKEHDSAAEVLAANEVQAPDLESVLQELDRWRERENQLRMEVGAARQKVDVLDDLRVRRRELENEIERLNLRISRYRQLETAFGRDGVPALLIEQALPQIESRANRILDRLSDGGMSVQFKTQEAYKDTRREDLRETLNIEISDGSGARDYEMYSGGEAFRVNFAIRLALSEVLAQRAGARLQMLVIDEGFGSQDLVGRQRLVEAINLVKDEFAKILVITHIDELKDVFPSRVEVEKTPQGSQVRVQ